MVKLTAFQAVAESSNLSTRIDHIEMWFCNSSCHAEAGIGSTRAQCQAKQQGTEKKA